MYLVINLGLKSIRGIIFDREGKQIYSKAFPVHTFLYDKLVEQDATEWIKLLDKILIGIKEHNSLSKQILFITVTTSSSCILGVDSKGNALTKVLMVSDKRSSKEVEQICSNNYYQLLSNKPVCTTGSTIPKLLWFKKNEKELFDKVDYWLGAGEFFNYFFTHNFFTDSLNASKGFFNGISYELDLLNSLEISSSSLPVVKEIGYTLPVCSEVIFNYNLNPDVQFTLTTYDAICAVIGSSDGKKTTASDVSGTVTSVRILAEKTPQDQVLNNSTLLYQPIKEINKIIIGSSNNLGGGIIEWYKQAFFKDYNGDVYSQMESQANSSTIGASGIIFLPYLLGERAPFVDLDAKGTFFGAGRGCDQKDFSRAVFESTAFVTRDLLDSIRINGFNVETLTVSGGLARFELINQIKADVCNVPVNVLENFESTSIGAFLLMALFSKEFSSYEEACSTVIKVRKILIPRKINHQFYTKSFYLFKDLNLHLTPLYKTHKLLNSPKHSFESRTLQNL